MRWACMVLAKCALMYGTSDIRELARSSPFRIKVRIFFPGHGGIVFFNWTEEKKKKKIIDSTLFYIEAMYSQFNSLQIFTQMLSILLNFSFPFSKEKYCVYGRPSSSQNL